MSFENQKMFKCNSCWGLFSSEKALKKHVGKAKYCEKYKNITFMCNCGWSSKGIKNVDSHICTETPKIIKNSLKEKLDKLEEENLSLKKKIKILEKANSIEKLKNKIWTSLLERNTNIKIGKIISEKEDKMILHDNKEGDITIVVKNWEKSNFNQTIKVKKEDKKSYRPIETSKIVKIKKHKKTKPTINKIQKIDLEGFRVNFNNLFTKLENGHNYTNTVNDIKKERKKIIGKIGLTKFLEIIQEHISRFNEIFKSKNFPSKKTNDIICKGLGSLEKRLLRYGDYSKSYLELEEMTKFKQTLYRDIPLEENYTVYSLDNFCKNFYNYGVVLFPIKELIRKYLFNFKNLNNVIYVPLEKSTKEDPYSFYKLAKISKEKRFWRMDCRLEDFTNNFSAQIIPYLIKSFRDIYKDIFYDNMYREDYKTKCQVVECDCQQLLQNIVTMSRTRKLCDFLRELIIEKASYQPTDMDKFDLRGDDALQRKRFAQKNKVDPTENIKLLFDNLTSEVAVDIYRESTT